MEVSVRIDCTPGEARRLIGAPDLLPLCQVLCVALEDWLVCLIARLDPPPPAQRSGVGQAPDDA